MQLPNKTIRRVKGNILVENFMCVQAKSIQSCPTLCNPMDCSPPGSSVHGILQASILEGIAISSSRGSSQPRDRTWVSCLLHWQAYSSQLVPPGEPIHKCLLLTFMRMQWNIAINTCVCVSVCVCEDKATRKLTYTRVISAISQTEVLRVQDCMKLYSRIYHNIVKQLYFNFFNGGETSGTLLIWPHAK